MKKWQSLLFFVSCFLLPASCFFLTACRGGPAEAIKIPVKVAEARLEAIGEAVEYAGTIVSEEEAVVFPRASGKVSRKVLEEGDQVEKDGAILYFERDEVGYSFKPAPVISPIDGIVGKIYVDVGQSITPATPAAFVLNPNDMIVKFSVDEKYSARVGIGSAAEVRLDAYKDEVFKAKVARKGMVIDTSSRTFSVEAGLPDADGKLMSGMFGKVRLILTQKENVPVVPKDAVIISDGTRYLFIVKDGRVKRQTVETGILEGERIEITDGLSGGEKVVILGAERLNDGAEVIAEE